MSGEFSDPDDIITALTEAIPMKCRARGEYCPVLAARAALDGIDIHVYKQPEAVTQTEILAASEVIVALAVDCPGAGFIPPDGRPQGIFCRNPHPRGVILE